MAVAREPVVVGFLCHWCAYRAADLAGLARTPVSPALHTVRVLCSGRVEPDLVLKALAWGADGVLVVGCHPGGCHSVDGNVKAARRIALLRPLLEQLGISRERVEVVWAGASEGSRYAEEVERFVGRIRQLGPLGRPGPGGSPAGAGVPFPSDPLLAPPEAPR